MVQNSCHARQIELIQFKTGNMEWSRGKRWVWWITRLDHLGVYLKMGGTWCQCSLLICSGRWSCVRQSRFTCWSTCNWQAAADVGSGAAGYPGALCCLPKLPSKGSSRIWVLQFCWTSHWEYSLKGQNILTEPNVWCEWVKITFNSWVQWGTVHGWSEG